MRRFGRLGGAGDWEGPFEMEDRRKEGMYQSINLKPAVGLTCA